MIFSMAAAAMTLSTVMAGVIIRSNMTGTSTNIPSRKMPMEASLLLTRHGELIRSLILMGFGFTVKQRGIQLTMLSASLTVRQNFA